MENHRVRSVHNDVAQNEKKNRNEKKEKKK